MAETHEHIWKPNKGTCFCPCGAIHYTQLDRLIPIPGAASIYDTAICGCVEPAIIPPMDLRAVHSWMRDA